MNWITNTDTIIFDSEFNEKLDINLISNYRKIIFSDYELNEKVRKIQIEINGIKNRKLN